MKPSRIAVILGAVSLIMITALNGSVWSRDTPAWQDSHRPGHSAAEPQKPGRPTPGTAPAWPVEVQQLRVALDRNRDELQWVQELLQQAGETLYWAQTRHRQSAAAQRVLADQLTAVMAGYEAKQAQVAQLAEELQAVRTSLSANQRPANNYQARIAALENERERLRQVLAERDRQLAGLQDELQASRAEVRQTRSESAASQEQLLKRSAEYEVCQTQRAGLSAELQTVSLSEADARQTLLDATAARDQLQSDLSACSENLTLVRASFATIQPAASNAGKTVSQPPATESNVTRTVAPTEATLADTAQATSPAAATIADKVKAATQTVPPVRSLPVTVASAAPTGTDISLVGVKFRYDSAELTSESRAILDEVSRALRRQQGIRHEVAGHTDSQGSPAYNRWLSQRRAETVKAYLVSRGVKSGMLEARGYGGTQPIADNRTWEGLVTNRRVELRWIP